MFKIYFRQAIQILRQNMVMSVIAVLGTALAIMMIMTIIVTDEIKNASVAPEGNRNRTYYADGHLERDSTGTNSRTGSVKYNIIRDCLKELKVPEEVSVFYAYTQGFDLGVNTSGRKETFNKQTRLTDAAYWKIMTFRFIDGRAYTEEEFQSGIGVAVVCESVAREIFKGEDAIGKTMEIKGKEYKVTGIVQDVPVLFGNARSEIWIPYTSVNRYEDMSYLVAMMAKSTSDYAALYAEVRSMEKKYSSEHDGKTLLIRGPFNHSVFVGGIDGFSEEEVGEHINVLRRKRILILTILLLVPALNLSGISLSRIKKRASEIGVRKAFGAKKYVILIQVLYENFITSLIGGVLGLVLSYIVVFQLKTWLLGMPGDVGIPLNTLVSPTVFIAVFLVCLTINLLSAGLPALRASRVTIINSINQNER